MAILTPIDAEAKALSYQWTEENVQKPENLIDPLLAEILQNFSKAQQWQGGTGLATVWSENRQLFLAQVPKRVWDGTSQQRSSLGMPVTLNHVNSINAQIMDMLFTDSPCFDFSPKSRVNENEARAYKEILEWELDHNEIEEEVESGSDEALLDGTGCWKATIQKCGKYLLPKLEHVERQHILVPAGFRKPDLRKAPWVIHVIATTPEDLRALRGQPGWDIPDDLDLLGVEPQETPPRDNRQEYDAELTQEIARAKGRFEDDSAHPRMHKLELLEYTTNDWVITVLNRKKIIRKIRNSKPRRVLWLSAFVVRVKGRFDGLGVAFLAGPFQRLKQGVVNALLDALALSIFGMFKRRRGSFVFPQQARVSPGRIIDVDKMEDLEPIQLPEPSPQAYSILDSADAWASEASGAQDVAVQGKFPSQGSGGVGRTAAGMELLGQAATSKLRKYVKILERQVLVPFLEYCIEVNPYVLKQEIIQEIIDDEELEAYGLSQDAILEAGPKIKFVILAATKMARRQKAEQAMAQILPVLENEFMQQSLTAQEKVVDWDEVLNIMIKDIAGWPTKASFIRDMTKEEKMRNATNNDLLKQVALERVKAQIQTEGKIQQIDAEHAGRASRDVLKAFLDALQAKGVKLDQLGQMLGQMMAQQQVNRMGGVDGASQPVSGSATPVSGS